MRKAPQHISSAVASATYSENICLTFKQTLRHKVLPTTLTTVDALDLVENNASR